MTGRSSPIEAEQSILGGIMLDNGTLPEAREAVGEADFTDPRHRLVWRAIMSIQGEAVDEVAVTSWLRARGELEKAGGALFITELASRIPTAANIGVYLEVVRKAASVRSLYAAARRVMKDIEAGAELDEVLAAMAAATASATIREPEKAYDIFTEVKEVTDEMARRHDVGIASASESFVPTGFADLDKMLIGFGQGDLIIVAANSGVGKTALAINFADRQTKAGARAAFFSGEMTKRAIARRLLAATASVSHQSLRAGLLSDHEWPRAMAALGRMGENRDRFLINDTVDTIGKVCGLAMRMHAAKRFDVIFVDYLQHLVPRGGKSFNREIDVAAAASDLKNLARKLGCAVVVLSQMNKEGGLRESDAIKHVADVVIELDRPWLENKERDEKEAIVTIRKQRSGPLGDVHLEYHAHQVRFDDARFVPKEAPKRSSWHEKEPSDF